MSISNHPLRKVHTYPWIFLRTVNNASQPCNGGYQGECTEHAVCQAGVCSCDTGFYDRFGKCVPQIPADKDCELIPDECVPRSGCYNGRCRCQAGFYAKDGVCQVLLET